MAITTRQTSLLVQQDWKKLYQTFKDADFQSYDFETLRKSMIDYLRLYYPEDFNDYIESSEFIALLDLIAFLGQSLAFRTGLNARENFLDTAERRDSILKLARLISYNPKRNIPSSGLLKFDSVSTTESVTDSNGLNLSNLVVSWNDSANDNWQEQFSAILNSALISSQSVGAPGNSQILNSIKTDEYAVNLIPNIIPVYKFETVVDGSTMKFEAVGATSAYKTFIYETDPKPTGKFNILYRNDNLGNNSVNTGFFVYFKQGELSSSDFTLTDSLPNRIVNIKTENINNSDVWLYEVNPTGSTGSLWNQVPAIAGINLVYNNIEDKKIYQVNTKAGDQIDLIFGDGAFATIPQGNYRLFTRVSNGLSYKITPAEMQSIVIPLSYVSRTGRIETLTIKASLNYTVANATTRESLEDIRTKAPQQYYTQNRMITGEDYNTLPYTNYSNVLKVKAVNRTSSGVSRFLDVLDATGKYSSTNVFCQDGILYKNNVSGINYFNFATANDIRKVVFDTVIPILNTKEMTHFFYDKYPRFQLLAAGLPYVKWYKYPVGNVLFDDSGLSGVFANIDTGEPYTVGPGVSPNLSYLIEGAIVKFVAPSGQFFDTRGQLRTGTPVYDTETTELYASIVIQNGQDITLSRIIPAGAIVDNIIPVFENSLSADIVAETVDNIGRLQNFGIGYSVTQNSYYIISRENLDTTSDFDLTYAGNTSGTAKDASWLISFIYSNQQYQINYRGLEYIFESKKETKFYFDPAVKVFDAKTGSTIVDQINVLKVNSVPDSANPLGIDIRFNVYDNIVESDGYVNNNKIKITFTDLNFDGVPDNPDIFNKIVAPTVNPTRKYVFFKQLLEYGSFIRLQAIDANSVEIAFTTLAQIQLNKSLYPVGQIFYASIDDKFYELQTVNNDRVAVEASGYIYKTGRSDLYFQYRHNSPSSRRIDPSPNNIMDLYLLTTQYATDYQAWIQDSTNTVAEPATPTNEELNQEFNGLESFKPLSDTLIYNSAKFKPIIGSRSDPVLQATFKVIKNPSVVISDNDIKVAVISAVNNYFDIANWDFGEAFYFSELSAYLHKQLTPNISSIIIVPKNSSQKFGSLYQINAEPNEIIVSSATVADVEIISAITATQINQDLLGLNT